MKDLTLDELDNDRRLLAALASAGIYLQQAGFAPLFRLEPGQPPLIVLPGEGLKALGGGVPAPLAPVAPVPAPVAEVVPAPEPLPVAAPAPVDRVAADAEVPEDGAANKAAPWTPAEEAQAIQLRRDGLDMKQIAEQLGRPYEGLRFRFANKMADWQTRPLPVAAPVAAAPPAPVAAPVADAPPAAPPGLAPRLTAIIMLLPTWDEPELALDIAEAIIGGAGYGTVAADFGMDTKAVQGAWEAMREAVAPKGQKVLTLQQQADLLDVLRYRVAKARAVAAE
jgi:hypothetical protein